MGWTGLAELGEARQDEWKKTLRVERTRGPQMRALAEEGVHDTSSEEPEL